MCINVGFSTDGDDKRSQELFEEIWSTLSDKDSAFYTLPPLDGMIYDESTFSESRAPITYDFFASKIRDEEVTEHLDLESMELLGRYDDPHPIDHIFMDTYYHLDGTKYNFGPICHDVNLFGQPRIPQGDTFEFGIQVDDGIRVDWKNIPR
jgi:hypothetical protein